MHHRESLGSMPRRTVGTVGITDLLILLGVWGPCADCGTPQACPADLDGDCSIGINDLLDLLANWS